MQSITEFQDYKHYLKARLEQEKGPGKKARLAKAMGIPQAFLSQVLHTHVHLSPDHGYRAAQYWGLNPLEVEYFLVLIQVARTSTREFRAHLGDRLRELAQQAKNLTVRYRQPALNEAEHQWLYYSSWHFGAVHLLVTIPGYQSASAVAKRLGLSKQVTEDVLARLKDMGLVTFEDNKWMVTKQSLHLPKNSPVSIINHTVWRSRASQSLLNGEPSDFHYTALHTLSRKDLARVQDILRQSVDSIRDVVTPSPEEELVCFSCDLFSV